MNAALGGSAAAIYVNGHGFGHATRCIAVVNELWRQRPGLRIVLRTDAPPFLFNKSWSGPYELVPGTVDPGTVQADPLHLDRRASIEARVRFQEGLPERLEQERRLLSRHGVSLVLGDIPPLAFEVAASLGVPSVALGNFSWDWIFSPYLQDQPGGPALVEAMQRSYRRADLLLRLPLHGPMEAFEHVQDVPHVVRSPTLSQSDVRRTLGVHEDPRALVLVSFGGFAAVRFPPGARPDPGPYRFVTFGDGPPGLPADTIRLPVDHPYGHEDLVAAADALIMKPGYGTIAECLASRTPFLYTSRDDFQEYEVLVEGIQNGVRCGFLPREDLLSMRWRPHLEPLLADRRPWTPVATNGAAVAAGCLSQYLE